MELLDLPEEDLSHIRTLPHVYQADYKDHTLTVLCDGGRHNLMRLLGYLQEKTAQSVMSTRSFRR